MLHSKGLPAALQQEIIAAVRPIVRKYAALRKSHLSRDRIGALVDGAVNEVIAELWRDVPKDDA